MHISKLEASFAENTRHTTTTTTTTVVSGPVSFPNPQHNTCLVKAHRISCPTLCLLCFALLCSAPFRTQKETRGKTVRATMSLACLVCHSVENPSPSHSFRRSLSNSENEGRCYAIANCLTRKLSVQPQTAHSFLAAASSKVTPQPTGSSNGEVPGTPRLVRSRAVRRDIVQDWNFDEVVSA